MDSLNSHPASMVLFQLKALILTVESLFIFIGLIVQFLIPIPMFFNKFDSYYYSRPISYRSYNPRLTRPSILQENDQQAQEVCGLLTSNGIKFDNLGGLSRGIRFDDIEVGKRHFNHNSHRVSDEYYIHQWKKTNDLSKQHPTGVFIETHSFPELMNKLINVIEVQRKKY